MLHLADPYQPDKMLTFDVHLPEARYDTPQKQAAWYAAAWTGCAPCPASRMPRSPARCPIATTAGCDDCADREPSRWCPANSRARCDLPVSAGYFAALHIPIVAGRGFSQAIRLDAAGGRGQPAVRRALLSRRKPARPAHPHGRPPTAMTPWLTIVGVAEETSYSTVGRRRPSRRVYGRGAGAAAGSDLCAHHRRRSAGPGAGSAQGTGRARPRAAAGCGGDLRRSSCMKC